MNKRCYMGNSKRIVRLFVSLCFVSSAISPIPSIASPNSNFGQSKADKVTLEHVLLELQAKFNNSLVYNVEDISNIQVQNINMNSSLTAILDQLFESTPFKYEKVNDHIVIVRDKAPQITKSQEKSDMLRITGRVLDETGQALPGVTIQVDKSTRGVSTDLDGSFTIELKKGESINVSFVGYQTQKHTITSEKDYTFILEPQVNELDEVAIVAFGKQKKESVVSSITTVKPSELKVPSSNLTTALAGRIAGLISYQTSGEPGQDNAQFYIRGVSSFGAGSKKDPLILIDNIEMTANDLARLQTDDIASFSIMKDASAAALYGARGANGVILVTTKEGKEGSAKVSVRFETSASMPTREVELADPITYMRLHNEAVKTRNPLGVLPYSESKIANTRDGVNDMAFPATDWFDMLFKDMAVNTRLNFNVSGGGKVARYYLAGTFNQDNGVLKVDGKNNFNNNINLKKYVLRSNININLSKTTEAVVRLHGTFDDYVGPLDGGSAIYNQAIQANPVLFPAVYRPDAKNQMAKQILFGNYENGGYINPYANLVRGYKDESTSMMLAQVELKQKLDIITKGLSFRLLGNTTRSSFFDARRVSTPYYYGLDSYDRLTDAYTLKQITTGSEGLTYEEGTNDISSSFYMETALDYSRTFKEKHSVSALMVLTMRSSLNANAGTLQKSLAYRNMGIAGRLTYAFDNKYFTEANFGYNGSERFSKNERWGFFPSLGLGWMVSNENFYTDGLRHVMPKMKFKFTYGLVGNDAIGSADDRFFYLSQVNLNDGNKGFVFGSQFGEHANGVSIQRYDNDKITWETSHKMNIGAEFNLFDKLEIQADYFTEKRDNILMDRTSIPTYIGLSAPVRANVGKAKSYGAEVSLEYNQSVNQHVWLTGRANFTYAASEFVAYEEPNYPNMPWLSKVGRNLGQNEGYIAERLFVDEYDIYNSPTQNFSSDRVMAGDIKYKDINKDGKITELDKVAIGFPTTPEIIYGFGFSMGVRGFDLSAFFQGSARSSFWIDPSATSPFIGGQTALLKAYAEDHWSEDNRNIHALWPRLSETRRANNMQTSTWFMRDGGFLRLKSAEVGYTLPKRFTKRIKMDMIRVYASGTNLFTFSKFKLWDVEMGGNGLGYPIQKVFNGGIQINF
ncbi:MAG: TonB-dependent receptor [Marinifilaceae bacterium]